MDRLRKKVFSIIDAGSDGSFISKAFDIFIISLILLNVILVFMDTFPISESTENLLNNLEVISIIIFTVEYILRIWTADFIYPNRKPYKARLRYIVSFMAMIDLLAILPFYLPFFLPLDLRVLRLLRVLRIFRIFKINRYNSAISRINYVFKKTANQLLSSMFIVSLLMIITSVLMYYIENPAQPKVFQNAFSGLWWAVSTITTIGYGDIYPITVMGRILSAIIALLGIGFIAVPTGIISAGFMEVDEEKKIDVKHYCPYCGKKIDK